MADPDSIDITDLLLAAEAGTPGALDRVLPAVYHELKQLAEAIFRGERPEHTLQATALVHEAYLKLVSRPDLDWKNRRHFFGIAAKAMRQILVDHARRRGAQRREGGRAVTLDEALFGGDPADEILGVDEALERLAVLSPRAARVVELRYFAGLTLEETAQALDCSLATVKRDWLSARAWLHQELS